MVTNKFIITGTDTDIGKTVFSAMLMLGLEEKARTHYWKPVQSGVEGGVDTRMVQKLTALPDSRFLPEQYVLSEPLSPHRAAELDQVWIKPDEIVPPDHEGCLLIEGAGGLMVPLTRQDLLIDVFRRWQIPVVLCARTALGTINHTLLSIEALKSRNIPVLGIAFIGDDNPDNIRTIGEYSGETILGHMPILPHLNPQTLLAAFRDGFNTQDFGL